MEMLNARRSMNRKKAKTMATKIGDDEVLPNGFKAGCSCHLLPTLRAVGCDFPPHAERMLMNLESASPFKNPAAFEEHMQIEERFILPHLSTKDQQRLLSDHSKFRTGRATQAFFEGHAAWERKAFKELALRKMGLR